PEDAGSGNEDGGGLVEDGGRTDSGADSDAGSDAGSDKDGGADAGACEPFGHFGVPVNSFTLPAPNAGGTLYHPDVQASFPAVNWATLDRLYLRAGRYKQLNLGNLPVRTAARPLVITNLGGQVLLRPDVPTGAGYLWSVNGGSNWIITGRYDPVSLTGDVAFPGHRCGDYANSRARYGILSDDAFASGGHMGIGIGNATDFELDFLEITRSGFAGVRANRGPGPDGGVPSMANVRIHDLYIHDTDSEGIYFGSTQAPPTPLAVNLQVYNNRIVRSGTEALQIQNLGPGTEVHHNVIAFGAIDWRNAFQLYQDNNTQMQLRSGVINVHHNVFMGAAASLLSFFSGPEAGDPGRTVTFTDNYFADTLNLGIYFGGTSGADSSYRWERNAFRGLDFGYSAVYPTATDPGVVFRVGGTFTSPINFTSNQWEGTRQLATTGNLTLNSNVNGPVPPFEFVDTGLPAGTATRDLEMWAAAATLAPGDPPVTYPLGQLVMHDGQLYRALRQNTGKIPPASPADWALLPLPVDDLRTRKGSPWQQRGIGLLDAAP
ncbi:MAG: right-handed parallel beta-helix repeat-containing protein, partial [Myxococcaceae bacterium]